MYSQIRVTISPNAPYHSMYLGARICAPFSMKSKSRIRFSAATPMITRLITIPRVPPECRNPMFIPNRLDIQLSR